MIKISLVNPPQDRVVGRSHLERLFEIHYTPQLTFENEEVENFIRSTCAKADRKGKIDRLAKWLGSYHGLDLDAEKIPNIALRWIHEKIGYGMFADEPFKKWQFIGEYAGLLRRRNHFFHNVNDYCFMYPRPLKLQFKAFTIDSEKRGNFTRFINHSDLPNAEAICVFHGGIFRVVIRACKAIKIGEEITYDYGEYYWQRRVKLVEENSLKIEGAWLSKVSYPIHDTETP
ncbi:MAG: SET domain-containing protein-lysine N-methyltransferase [Chlamydiia bacterium]|nr:SET domain-containing protein-lysine N-methyltransferase [Chlamydiia bacterium]